LARTIGEEAGLLVFFLMEPSTGSWKCLCHRSPVVHLGGLTGISYSSRLRQEIWIWMNFHWPEAFFVRKLQWPVRPLQDSRD